jgi:putative hydrolase of the HAD superfamily
VKRPRAIFLDLDDTILDDTGCVDECWSAATARGEQMLPGLGAGTLQETIREYANWWWSDPGRNQSGRLDLRNATTSIVAECLRRLGFEDGGAARSIANHYRDLRDERVRPYDGAIETIEWFRSQGFLLGLMTNGAGPAQYAKIERFGLAAHFGHVVIEGELGVGKPHPRVFETLLRALDVGPDETWAVGDNLEADVRGAMRVGLHGVWVDRQGKGLQGRPGETPDRVIRELRDLRSI